MKKLLLVLSVVAMASFLFVGCLPGAVTPEVNDAPEITSTAITSGTVGEAYTYDVDATDPDEGDTLAYSLDAAPTGMAIVAATGVISWTPAAAGTFSVIVSVSDGELTDTQNFALTVSEAEVEPEPENTAPEITSTAVTSVTLPAAYSYAVVATDAEGDTLTYDLIPKYGFAPVGMTISSAGVINWTPTVADVGIHSVTVEVSDGELTDEQSFTVTVSPVPVGPTVVSLLPLDAIVGEAYAGAVTATAGDDATLTYSLVGAPTGMTIVAATGVISWTPAAAGNQVVTVVVTDAALLSDTEDFTIVVAARVAPALNSIVNQIAYYGEVFTYDAEATAGTSSDLTFSLTENPIMMIINPDTGEITWTPIAAQLGYSLVTVKVTAADGLFDEVSFFIEVQAPIVIPVTATIVYDPSHSYVDSVTYVRGFTVDPDDCVPVTVTFNEVVEHDVQVRWYDIDGVAGNWVDLDDSGDGITFEGCLPFDPTDVPDGPSATWDDCEVVCVEWRLFDEELVCCPEYETDPVSFGAVYVDFEAPCASFVVTVEDCDDPCEDWLEISWTTGCEGPCDLWDCCCDECSGVNGWELLLDASDDPICNPGECDIVSGNDCAIDGEFGCGLDCLVWADSGETVTYTIDYSVSDNVGNEFTDVWTIIVDTDSVTSFTAPGATVVTETIAGEEFTLDYGCTCDECDDCYPLPVEAE